MRGKFLRAAYQALHLETKPLSAEQIVEVAKQLGILRSAGKTPTNTMRARLSDEIREKGGDSLFQRVGANRFGLREWNFAEYHARPFQKELPNEVTVCVPGRIGDMLNIQGCGYREIPPAFLEYLTARANLQYIPRRDAEITTAVKQLIAYVWLETSDGRVLSYTRGKYSSAHPTLLLGRQSVGFGGHVLRQDSESLFGANDAGLYQAALREISEELKVKVSAEINPAGMIWDESSFEGQKHIGVVMRGVVPWDGNALKRGREQSINQVQLLRKGQLWDAYHAMEFWSQLLIRQFAAQEKPRIASTIVPGTRPRNIGHIVLVGEIANGKSSIAAALAKEHGYRVISASSVLRRILRMEDIGEHRRLEFQEIALKFINTEEGPAKLAAAIAEEVGNGQGIAVIDGVRQINTLNSLRGALPRLMVLYVDCPRDFACRNYQIRVPGAAVTQFAAIREHEVEAELPLFRYQADAILNNADDLETTMFVLLRWLKGGKPT